MPSSKESETYEPIYIVELYLDSGLEIISTKDVEIIEGTESGFGRGGFGRGGFGHGGAGA